MACRYWFGRMIKILRVNGVHPNEGAAGESFVFRVKYRDADDDEPELAQVWIDANDDYIYSESEKHHLTKEGMGVD